MTLTYTENYEADGLPMTSADSERRGCSQSTHAVGHATVTVRAMPLTPDWLRLSAKHSAGPSHDTNIYGELRGRWTAHDVRGLGTSRLLAIHARGRPCHSDGQSYAT